MTQRGLALSEDLDEKNEISPLVDEIMAGVVTSMVQQHSKNPPPLITPQPAVPTSIYNKQKKVN